MVVHLDLLWSLAIHWDPFGKIRIYLDPFVRPSHGAPCSPASLAWPPPGGRTVLSPCHGAGSTQSIICKRIIKTYYWKSGLGCMAGQGTSTLTVLTGGREWGRKASPRAPVQWTLLACNGELLPYWRARTWGRHERRFGGFFHLWHLADQRFFNSWCLLCWGSATSWGGSWVCLGTSSTCLQLPGHTQCPASCQPGAILPLTSTQLDC